MDFNLARGGTVTVELELALVREALQTRLLVELMSNAMHKELVLKGGMAMRAVHGSCALHQGHRPGCR